MKIIFLSGCAAALPALNLLQAKGHSLTLLCPADAPGRSALAEIRALDAWAAQQEIPCWPVEAARLEEELAELIRETTPHLVLAFGFPITLNPNLLAPVRHGGWNIHFSLQPAQRPSAELEGQIYLHEWRGDQCCDLLLQRRCTIPVQENEPLEALGVHAAELLEQALYRAAGIPGILGWRSPGVSAFQ